VSTGQYPRTRKTARQVYDELLEARRSATDTFKQFVASTTKRRKKES
jgi:hypothetical protein